MALKQLTPEQYVIQRGRKLPIYKCYITKHWEEEKIANVIVVRKHTNGNFTAGFYLIDLLCLGVKDTFVLFNMPKDDLKVALKSIADDLDEIEYNLAHNIIFAGHDFALDFDIQPHEDFEVNRFLLEEDDDHIPIIEIPVGDEEGKPFLYVIESFNYAPIIKKLEKHAGAGNYTFETHDEFETVEEEEPLLSLDDIEDGFLDFEHVTDMDTDELESAIETGQRNRTDSYIIKVELLFRRLHEQEPGTIIPFEALREEKHYKLFEAKLDQWKQEYESNTEEIETVFQQLVKLQNLTRAEGREAFFEKQMELLEAYKENAIISQMIMGAVGIDIILPSFSLLLDYYENANPAVQLTIAAFAVAQHIEFDHLPAIQKAPHVEMLYPFNRSIMSVHHKTFWVIKALLAIHDNDKQSILHYHNLVRIAGVGGHIKFLYSVQLHTWLEKELEKANG